MTKKEERSFLVYWGSTALLNDLAAHGASIDVDAYERDWQAKKRHLPAAKPAVLDLSLLAPAGPRGSP
jgi:hypothetical protein